MVVDAVFSRLSSRVLKHRQGQRIRDRQGCALFWFLNRLADVAVSLFATTRDTRPLRGQSGREVDLDVTGAGSAGGAVGGGAPGSGAARSVDSLAEQSLRRLLEPWHTLAVTYLVTTRLLPFIRELVTFVSRAMAVDVSFANTVITHHFYRHRVGDTGGAALSSASASAAPSTPASVPPGTAPSPSPEPVEPAQRSRVVSTDEQGTGAVTAPSPGPSPSAGAVSQGGVIPASILTEDVTEACTALLMAVTEFAAQQPSHFLSIMAKYLAQDSSYSDAVVLIFQLLSAADAGRALVKLGESSALVTALGASSSAASSGVGVSGGVSGGAGVNPATATASISGSGSGSTNTTNTTNNTTTNNSGGMGSSIAISGSVGVGSSAAGGTSSLTPASQGAVPTLSYGPVQCERVTLFDLMLDALKRCSGLQGPGHVNTAVSVLAARSIVMLLPHCVHTVTPRVVEVLTTVCAMLQLHALAVDTATLPQPVLTRPSTGGRNSIHAGMVSGFGAGAMAAARSRTSSGTQASLSPLGASIPQPSAGAASGGSTAVVALGSGTVVAAATVSGGEAGASSVSVSSSSSSASGVAVTVPRAGSGVAPVVTASTPAVVGAGAVSGAGPLTVDVSSSARRVLAFDGGGSGRVDADNTIDVDVVVTPAATPQDPSPAATPVTLTGPSFVDGHSVASAGVSSTGVAGTASVHDGLSGGDAGGAKPAQSLPRAPFLVGFDLLDSATPLLSAAALLLKCLYGLFPSTTLEHLRRVCGAPALGVGGAGASVLQRVILAVMLDSPFVPGLLCDPAAEQRPVRRVLGACCEGCSEGPCGCQRPAFLPVRLCALDVQRREMLKLFCCLVCALARTSGREWSRRRWLVGCLRLLTRISLSTVATIEVGALLHGSSSRITCARLSVSVCVVFSVYRRCHGRRDAKLHRVVV